MLTGLRANVKCSVGDSWVSDAFLNYPLALIHFLFSAGASSSQLLAEMLLCSDSSNRKCTFLCPGAKPFSMFLASC
jgi:hypothetical protein